MFIVTNLFILWTISCWTKHRKIKANNLEISQKMVQFYEMACERKDLDEVLRQ